MQSLYIMFDTDLGVLNSSLVYIFCSGVCVITHNNIKMNKITKFEDFHILVLLDISITDRS